MAIAGNKIEKLLADGKYYLVNKSYDFLLKEYNSSYECVNSCDEYNIQYIRLLIKSLNLEYNNDPISEITTNLYLKLSKLINISYLNTYSVDLSLVVNNFVSLNILNSVFSKWGYIQGNIQDQLDLIALLSTKSDIGDGLITPVNINIVNSNLIITANVGNDIKWKIGNTIVTILSPKTISIIPATNNFFRKDLVLLSLTDIIILQGIEDQNLPLLANAPINTAFLSVIDIYGTIVNSTSPQSTVDIVAPSWKVYGNQPFGKYTNGMDVPYANSAYEQYKNAWTNIAAPNYLAPLTTLTSTPSTSGLEVGQTLNVNLTLSFNQRNGGAETAREIRKNGVVLGATTDTIVISTTLISYLGNISYVQGAVLNNQAGVPDPNGRINEGNVNSNTINYVGSLFNFFGVGTIATTSAQVRALAGKTTSNTFTLTLVAGQTQASFAYPATKSDISDSSVKYVEGFNSNVGNTFTKALFNVNDAGGVPVAYKIYTVTLPAPETGTVTYNVTLP